MLARYAENNAAVICDLRPCSRTLVEFRRLSIILRIFMTTACRWTQSHDEKLSTLRGDCLDIASGVLQFDVVVPSIEMGE